jgi:glycosyltransferase 2 family protein
MKKLISITLKLILAAAGIGYIVLTLSWHDQVLIPVGYTFADGAVAQQEVLLRVLAEEPDGWRMLQGPVEGASVRVHVPTDDMTADQPRFKPGIVSMLYGADWRLLLLGLALVLPVFPIQAARWWMLMRCRGMDVPFARAMRLTMVGLFFNFCMPGMTGGDVVKGYYAAKGSGSRGIAVMSVIFDRAAGLMGLMMLAGIAGIVLLTGGGGLDAEVQSLVQTVTVLIWLGIAGVLFSAYLYFSLKVRRLIGFQRLIDRMGPDNFLVRIDDAAAAYRDHKRLILITVLISLPVHLCQAMATTCAGWALGMELSAGLMLTVLPVVFLAGSVPLTYQGLGVMEALAVAMLLPSPYADANQLVSMLVLIRLFLIIYALVGAVQMLRGDIHLFPQAEAKDAGDDGAVSPTDDYAG